MGCQATRSPACGQRAACTSGVARVARTFAWDSAEPGEDRDDLVRGLPGTVHRLGRARRGAPGACRGARSPGPRTEAAGAGRAPRQATRLPAGPPAGALAAGSGPSDRRARGRAGRPRHRRQLPPPPVRRARSRRSASLRLPDRKPRRSSVTWTNPSSPQALGDRVGSPVLPEAPHLLARRSRDGRARRGGGRGTPGIRAPGRPPRPGRPGGASRR